jgi:hypothetical protein
VVEGNGDRRLVRHIRDPITPEVTPPTTITLVKIDLHENQAEIPPSRLDALTATAAAARGAGMKTVLSGEVEKPMTTPNNPGQLYAIDWESFNCGDTQPPANWTNEWDAQAQAPYRVACSPDPVRSGGRAGRFELNQTDPITRNSKRTELAAASDPDNAERWYGFSIFLPEGWVVDTSAEVLTQWHQSYPIPDPLFEGSPPLALGIRGQQWEIRRRKWEDLAALIKPKTVAKVGAAIERAAGARRDSDAIFEAAYRSLIVKEATKRPETWIAPDGVKLATISTTEDKFSLVIDRKISPDFGSFLTSRLEQLYNEFLGVKKD